MRQLSSFAFGTGLVSASAIISSVLMYWNSTYLRATRSRAKWYITSMCLERCDDTGFLSSLMVLWLSSMMSTVPVLRPRLYISLRSHSASLVVMNLSAHSARLLQCAACAATGRNSYNGRSQSKDASSASS